MPQRRKHGLKIINRCRLSSQNPRPRGLRPRRGGYVQLLIFLPFHLQVIATSGRKATSPKYFKSHTIDASHPPNPAKFCTFLLSKMISKRRNSGKAEFLSFGMLQSPPLARRRKWEFWTNISCQCPASNIISSLSLVDANDYDSIHPNDHLFPYFCRFSLLNLLSISKSFYLRMVSSFRQWSRFTRLFL